MLCTRQVRKGVLLGESEGIWLRAVACGSLGSERFQTFRQDAVLVRVALAVKVRPEFA
jgi:hypothetical protein